MKRQLLRRKKSLVDREMQFGFAWIIFAYLVLYTLFLVVMMAIPIWWIVEHTPGAEFDKMAAVGRFILEDNKFWILLALFIVTVSLHSVIATRKIAGPIFVFRRHLKRAINGELSRISLRKKDNFHDVKDLINDHFDQVMDTATQIRGHIGSAQTHLAELEKAMENTVAPDLSAQISKVREEIVKANELISSKWTYSA